MSCLYFCSLNIVKDPGYRNRDCVSSANPAQSEAWQRVLSAFEEKEEERQQSS